MSQLHTFPWHPKTITLKSADPPTAPPTSVSTAPPPTSPPTTAPPTSPPTSVSTAPPPTTAPPTSPPTSISTAPPTSPPTSVSTTSPPTTAPPTAPPISVEFEDCEQGKCFDSCAFSTGASSLLYRVLYDTDLDDNVLNVLALSAGLKTTPETELSISRCLPLSGAFKTNQLKLQ